MDFIIENFLGYKFSLYLLSNVENLSYLNLLEKDNNVVVLNPQYIISVYQIMLAINRSLYNFYILNKKKSDKLKKEIIYFTVEKGKIDACCKLHKISNENPNIYILFINRSREEIEKIKGELKGTEIKPENYSKFVDYDIIRKEFDIKDAEIENEAGILGAVYNRIAIKELK